MRTQIVLTSKKLAACLVAAALLGSSFPANAQQQYEPQPQGSDAQAPAAAPEPAAPPAVETEPVKPPEPAPAPAGAPPAPARMTAPPLNGGGVLLDSLSTEPIDFNFKDADLSSVLRGFGLKYNKNFVTGPGVGGRVTMALHGVPFDEAFETLLNHLGLVAIQRSPSIIEIIRSADMPVLSHVFTLKYRFAPDVAFGLNIAFPKSQAGAGQVIIAVDQASNSLIVTGTTVMLEKVKRIIEQIDIESPQIAIKARLIEVSVNNALNWGLTWLAQSQFDRNGTNATTRGIFNSGVLTGANQNGGGGGLNGQINTANALGAFPTGGVFDISAVLDRKTYYGLINAIKSDTHTKTISEPMILTGNNKSSKIHVGQNLPVKTTTQSQTSTVQNVQYIPEGVDLEVTPIVSPGSNIISFKIRVNVSQFLNFQNDAPVTAERSAQTEVSVESGKTVVIGGLMTDKISDNDSGIPFLMKIPLIGWLFKNKQKSKDRTELLIFMTPELLAKDAPLKQEPF